MEHGSAQGNINASRTVDRQALMIMAAQGTLKFVRVGYALRIVVAVYSPKTPNKSMLSHQCVQIDELY